MSAFSDNINNSVNFNINGGASSNKSMPQSPVSVASAVSSETTSESQSVSDEQTTTAASAIVVNRNTPRSNRKQSVQHERPPWRTVITAPVDKKVNKNALLKAKLLDATRRALLAQRICHVGTQTDTVVILREKAIGVQKDLIRMVDKCEDTDGTITIRRDRPGGLVITQTVGQMTEYIRSSTVGTQTPLPKTNLSFPLIGKGPANDANRISFDEQMRRNDLLLQQQMNALLVVDKNLKKTIDSPRDCDMEAEESAEITATKSFLLNENFVNSVADNGNSVPSKYTKSSCNNSTYTCWDDFNVSDDDSELPDLPRKTISEGSTPWNNFKDLIIGQRVASMTLSPMSERPKKSLKKKSVTWNDRQLAVTRLLNEASALIDIFDEMSMILGPEVKLNQTPCSESNAVTIPESKLNLILSESCDALQEKLINFKPNHHLDSIQILAPSKNVN